MSKKLEESYKSIMAEEVPDLWDRISQNLPEKTPNTTTAKPAGQVIEFKSIKRAPEGSIRKIEKKNRLARLSGLAVACLALVVIIPVVINTTKATKDDERQRRRHEDKGTAEAVAPVDLEEGAQYKTLGEASYAAVNSYDAEIDSTDFVESPEAWYENSTNQKDEATAIQENEDESREGNKSVSMQTQDGTITVMVNIVESNFDEEGEISYSAVVKDALGSNGIVNGQSIVIYSNGGAQDNLESGKTYTFSLKYVDTLEDGRPAYCFK